MTVALELVDKFMITLARVGGIVAVAPVFSARYPALIKVGITAALAMLLTPVIAFSGLPDTGGRLVTLVIAETLIGLGIGFAATVVFACVQVAGQVLDMELGFGIVNVIDPQYGTQVPLIGSFLQILTLIVFLAIDGHHLVIQALRASYDLVPIGQLVIRPELTGLMMELFCAMFSTAVKIALPVAGAMFCVNAALGLVAKTVPQMNVFIVGMPIKVVGGIVVLMLALPLFANILSDLFSDIAQAMDMAIRLLGR